MRDVCGGGEGGCVWHSDFTMNGHPAELGMVILQSPVTPSNLIRFAVNQS